MKQLVNQYEKYEMGRVGDITKKGKTIPVKKKKGHRKSVIRTTELCGGVCVRLTSCQAKRTKPKKRKDSAEMQLHPSPTSCLQPKLRPHSTSPSDQCFTKKTPPSDLPPPSAPPHDLRTVGNTYQSASHPARFHSSPACSP
jgi:hypothetical protein